MAPLSATPSDPKTVAAVLANRGFVWQYAKVEDVQSNSRNVSFEEEWQQFASKVADISDAVTNVPPRNADDVWNNHFKNVITNRGNGYGAEESFSSALFEALRDSLKGFVVCPIANCKDGSNKNLIVLHSTSINVGFGKEVHRKKLGFDDNYGLSTNCIPDHGCFVFGTMKKQSSSGTGATKEFYDMTAVVELKLEKTSCESFAFDEDAGIVKQPSFVKAHGPMGQAMIYSMDVWHCLARRGLSVPSVPVVMLAGKSKLEAARSTKTSSKIPKLEMLDYEYESNDSDRLCCVEACIYIPEYCGEIFLYSVNHIVSFNGTTGLTTDDVLSESMAAALQNTRDKRAMALYIRTMRIGLEHALQVSKRRTISSPVSPVSLCCRRLLKNRTDVPLVASPIPLEDYPGRPGISINQGELFEILEPTIAIFAGISRLVWFVDAEREDTRLTSNCLVKVSCVSVHNTYISHSDCRDALSTLYDACTNNETLKKELAKVLLGYWFVKDLSLVIIMKDLRSDCFTILDHQKIRNDRKLPELWLGFCGLVKSVLLPMAKEGVVHMDIRSTSTITSNILYCSSAENGIELHLVDFDSLVHFESAFDDTIIEQDYALYWKNVKINDAPGVEFAYRYLFWQVFWIAYTWHPLPVTKDTLPKKPNARNFVFVVFKDNYFVEFKEWLGSVRVTALQNILSNEMSHAGVEQALDVLKDSFCGKFHQD